MVPPKGVIEKSKVDNISDFSPEELYIEGIDELEDYDNEINPNISGTTTNAIALNRPRRKAAVSQNNKNQIKKNEDNKSNWNLKENLADYVTDYKIEESFLREYEKDYVEPINTPPVFETNSFFRGLTDLHSYMGLRYTRKDSDDGRLHRKRIAVGFGSQKGTLSGVGKLMNENGNKTDASSETPITVDNLNRTFNAIQNTNDNIVETKKKNFIKWLFTSGKRKNTEFSGNYNVLTNNCNDFVIAMAKAAGVTVPEKLHDSIWGPFVVYKHLREAAEKGVMEGGTRIFFSNAIDPDSTGKPNLQVQQTLLNDFISRARFGASKDGINLEDEKEFMSLLTQVDLDAKQIQKYLEAQNSDDPNPEILPNNMTEEVIRISNNVRKAVEFKTKRKHQKITRYLLKVEALAKTLITNDTRAIESLTDEEIEYATTELTNAEKFAKQKNETVTEKSLLNGENIYVGPNLAIGELMLTAIGLPDHIRTSENGNMMSDYNVSSELDKIIGAVRSDLFNRFDEYLLKFIGARNSLSNSTISKYIAVGVANGLGLANLRSTMALHWSIQESDPDFENKIKRTSRSYTTVMNLNNTDPQSIQQRTNHIQKMIELETLIRAKVESLREKAEELSNAEEIKRENYENV